MIIKLVCIVFNSESYGKLYFTTKLRLHNGITNMENLCAKNAILICNMYRKPAHLIKLKIATYNAGTLRTNDKIIEQEEELSNTKWDIVGFYEVWTAGES